RVFAIPDIVNACRSAGRPNRPGSCRPARVPCYSQMNCSDETDQERPEEMRRTRDREGTMKKVLALLAVGLLVTADRAKADDATEELKKLAGTWALVSEVADGEERDAVYLKKIKWI